MLRWTSRSVVGKAVALALGLSLIASGSAFAQTVNKANNADNLNLPSSWVGGIAPTPTDIAVWEATVLGANSTVLGDSLQSWLGMRILNPGGAVTIGAGAPDFVTLGASGIDMSAATQNLTLNNGVNLGAAQTWNVGTGRTLALGGVISDNAALLNTLTKSGTGTLTLSGASTYNGPTVLGQGTLNLNFAAAGAPANNILPTTTALSIRQGTSLNVTGAGVIGSAQQTVTSTQFGNAAGGLGLGMTTITVVDADALNPIETLNLGTISSSTGSGNATKNAGVAVRFIGPATQDAAGAPVAATGHIRVGAGGFSANTGIIGTAAAQNTAGAGYATVGLYDFAAVDINDGNLIKGGSQLLSGTFYTPVAATVPPATFGFNTGSGQQNYDFQGSVTVSSGGTNRFAESWRFNNPAATLIAATGGGLLHTNSVLVTPNMGANNVLVTGGVSGAIFDTSRQSGAGQHQTVFWQNNTQGFFNLDVQVTNARGNTADTLPGAVVKAGAGTMILNHSNNVYSGGTIIYEGALMFSGSDAAAQGSLGNPTETAGAGVPTVRINGGALVGNGAAVTLASTRGIGITNSATIASTNGNKLTVNGVISDQNGNTNRLTVGSGLIAGTGAGTANLTAQTGSGIVALAGASTYANGTDVTNGATLQAINLSGSATGTGTVAITSTSILAGTGTIAGAALPASGGHISAGLLGVNSGVGTLTTGGITTVSGSILDFDMSVAQNDLLRSTNGLTIPTGTVVNLFQAGTAGAYGTNGTYTMFDVTAGSIPSAASLNSNITIGNGVGGGSYNWGVAGTNVTLTITGLANASTWALNGGGPWNANLSWSPPVAFPNVAGDSATFANTSLTPGVKSVVLNGTRTVGNVAFNNTFGAQYSLDGPGTLALNNNASTAGVAVINGSHFITVPVTLASNTNMSVTNALETLTVSGAISGAQDISFSGGGKVVLSGANTYVNSSVAAGMTVQAGAGGTTGSVGTGTITLNGTLDVNRSNAVSLNAISGTGALVNSGGGTTTLSAPNTGAFSTTVNGGKILVGAGSNLGTGDLTANAGTVDVNGTSPTVTNLAGTAGTIDNSSATPVTVTAIQPGNTTFGGTLSDTGAGNLHFVKSGVGVLTLSGTTANGLTTSSYNAGAILVDSNIRVDAGQVILASNGALPAGKVLESRVAGVGVMIGGTGTTIAGTILIHPDSSTSSPTLDVVAGTAATITGQLTTPPTMTNPTTQIRFNAGSGTDLTTSLTVAGNGGINITVPTSFFFFERGNFTFAGNSNSTIRQDANIFRGQGGNNSITFKDNARFSSGLSTAPGTGNLILASGGGTVPISAVMTIQDNAVVTSYGGNIDVNGAAGAGGTTVHLDGGTLSIVTMTKSAASATTLNLNGGTIQSRGSGIIVPGTITGVAPGTDGAVVRAGGAKFDTNGFDSTVDAPLVHDNALLAVADGGLTKSGAGILTLSATSASAYAGPTAINGGTLVVNGTHGFNSQSAPVANYAVNATGRLAGIGTIGDGIVAIGIDVNNGGTINPGDYNAFPSPGTLNVNGGSVIFGAGGRMEAMVDASPGFSDLLSVTGGGTINLTAASNVLKVTSASPIPLGQSYTIATGTSLTGTFELVTPGYTATYNATSVMVQRTGNSADFDLDGDIDGDDLLTWQRNLGTIGGATQQTGDANNDGDVTGADLTVWRAQFPTAPFLVGSGAPVPEPGMLALAAIAVSALVSAARRRRA